MRWWCLLAVLLPLSGFAEKLDPAASQALFELDARWRWLQTLQGRFPVMEGEVESLPDGQRQVRLRLDARRAEIVGHPRYTRFARSERFFDAERHPYLEFVSDPYPPALLRDGGMLTGRLKIRGVERRESFRVAPAGCDAPARACAVSATGRIDRSDYGIEAWQLGLRNEVRFTLKVRLQDEAAP